MTLTPYIVWLSMFLMPLMLFESEYSEYVVTRFSISGVVRPV